LDAHHIVESTGKRAAPAREILDKYEIDINSITNGVPLQSSRPGAKINPGVRNHKGEGLHSYDGIDQVNNRLERAVRGASDWGAARQRVLDALAEIKAEILNGSFPN
jgi:hypothetical protein